MFGICKVSRQFANASCFQNHASCMSRGNNFRILTTELRSNVYESRQRPGLIGNRSCIQGGCEGVFRNNHRIISTKMLQSNEFNKIIQQASKNTGFLIKDRASLWYQQMQKVRRNKQNVLEQCKTLGISTQIQSSFHDVNKPIESKKFKRISPEFLKLLQNYETTIFQNYVNANQRIAPEYRNCCCDISPCFSSKSMETEATGISTKGTSQKRSTAKPPSEQQKRQSVKDQFMERKLPPNLQLFGSTTYPKARGFRDFERGNKRTEKTAKSGGNDGQYLSREANSGKNSLNKHDIDGASRNQQYHVYSLRIPKEKEKAEKENLSENKTTKNKDYSMDTSNKISSSLSNSPSSKTRYYNVFKPRVHAFPYDKPTYQKTSEKVTPNDSEKESKNQRQSRQIAADSFQRPREIMRDSQRQSGNFRKPTKNKDGTVGEKEKKIIPSSSNPSNIYDRSDLEKMRNSNADKPKAHVVSYHKSSFKKKAATTDPEKEAHFEHQPVLPRQIATDSSQRPPEIIQGSQRKSERSTRNDPETMGTKKIKLIPSSSSKSPIINDRSDLEKMRYYNVFKPKVRGFPYGEQSSEKTSKKVTPTASKQESKPQEVLPKKSTPDNVLQPLSETTHESKKRPVSLAKEINSRFCRPSRSKERNKRQLLERRQKIAQRQPSPAANVYNKSQTNGFPDTYNTIQPKYSNIMISIKRLLGCNKASDTSDLELYNKGREEYRSLGTKTETVSVKANQGINHLHQGTSIGHEQNASGSRPRRHSICFKDSHDWTNIGENYPLRYKQEAARLKSYREILEQAREKNISILKNAKSDENLNQLYSKGDEDEWSDIFQKSSSHHLVGKHARNEENRYESHTDTGQSRPDTQARMARSEKPTLKRPDRHTMCFKDSLDWMNVPNYYPKHYKDLSRQAELEKSYREQSKAKYTNISNRNLSSSSSLSRQIRHANCFQDSNTNSKIPTVIYPIHHRIAALEAATGQKFKTRAYLRKNYDTSLSLYRRENLDQNTQIIIPFVNSQYKTETAVIDRHDYSDHGRDAAKYNEGYKKLYLHGKTASNSDNFSSSKLSEYQKFSEPDYALGKPTTKNETTSRKPLHLR